MFKKLIAFLLESLLNNRGVTLNVTGVADVDDAIPTGWEKGVQIDGVVKAFFKKFMGKEGSKMPVIYKTEAAKAKGDTIIFNTIARLYSAGVSGESTLQGNETKLSVGSFTMTLEMYRNAVAITRKSTFQANFDQIKIAGMLNTDWGQREIDSQIFEELLTCTGETIYANAANRSTIDGLLTADKFGTTELDLIYLSLLRKKALPIAVAVDNGEEIPLYGCIISGIDSYHLRGNTTWLNGMREAAVRGEKNPLFTRAYGKYGGLLVYVYEGMAGVQGTPIRPEATVEGTLTTAATTITVGSDSKENLTRFFGSTGTLQIEDEFITYTGKGNITFTGCTRGATVGTVGSTNVQHVDKLITQRNISTAIGFGAEAIFFGQSEAPIAIGQKYDYGAEVGLGIEMYHGIEAVKDKRRGGFPNVVLCKCFSQNPGSI